PRPVPRLRGDDGRLAAVGVLLPAHPCLGARGGRAGRLPAAFRARWLRSPLTGLLAWAGLAGLAAVVLTFDAATAFPGAVAALPVLATAAMIIGGAAPG